MSQCFCVNTTEVNERQCCLATNIKKNLLLCSPEEDHHEGEQMMKKCLLKGKTIPKGELFLQISSLQPSRKQTTKIRSSIVSISEVPFGSQLCHPLK